jgi:thiol-disulfide isomerase/thioredoxin
MTFHIMHLVKWCSFVTYLCLPIVLVAQEIKIHIPGLQGTGYLYQISGENISLLDSTVADASGIYRFALRKPTSHLGVCRFSFANDHFIDIINDGNPVILSTTKNNVLDSIHIGESKSNNIFYAFKRLNRTYTSNIQQFQLLLTRYTHEDSTYSVIQENIKRLQNTYEEFIKKTSQITPGSLVAKYIRSAALPLIDYRQSRDQQLQFLKTHALDQVNFKDDELIYTDLYSNKTIEYLSYYSTPHASKDQLEDDFICGVDSILTKARKNKKVYTHIVEYLLAGFKKYDYERVMNHIVQRYVIEDDLCLDERIGSSILRRIEQDRKYYQGVNVPNIALTDISGTSFELFKCNQQKVLLVFYASWCPHCRSMLPQISDLKKKIRNFEVVAISLDTLRDEWMNYIKKHNWNFIHVSDLNGWDGITAQNYFIYAIPTMFLLDSKKRIIAKPMTIETLREKILE